MAQVVKGGRYAELQAMMATGKSGEAFCGNRSGALVESAFLYALEAEAPDEWRAWAWDSVSNLLAHPKEGMTQRFNGRRAIFGRTHALLRDVAALAQARVQGRMALKASLSQLRQEAKDCLRVLRGEYPKAMRAASEAERLKNKPAWIERKSFEIALNALKAATWAVEMLEDSSREDVIRWFCRAALEIYHTGMVAGQVRGAVRDLAVTGSAYPLMADAWTELH